MLKCTYFDINFSFSETTPRGPQLRLPTTRRKSGVRASSPQCHRRSSSFQCKVPAATVRRHCMVAGQGVLGHWCVQRIHSSL